MSDLFPETIETERLTLERLSREHVDVFEYYEICSPHDPDIEEVVEYISAFEPHRVPKTTEEFLRHVERCWDEGDGAEYVVRPRKGEEGAGEIAGSTGLTVDWERRTGSFGMWLRKPFWGRGYSGERADALFELAFDRLDLELVAVTHQVGNEKSRRAIEQYVERNGGQFDCLLRNWDAGTDDAADHRRYTVSREQYVG